MADTGLIIMTSESVSLVILHRIFLLLIFCADPFKRKNQESSLCNAR